MLPAPIAVVEDHEGLRRALVRLLQASGHEVRSYASAEELLAAPEHRSARCLILDVRLPGLSGFELHERLLAQGGGLPVIYVTAHDDPSVRLRAALAGAELLAKPVEREALLEAVSRALERA